MLKNWNRDIPGNNPNRLFFLLAVFTLPTVAWIPRTQNPMSIINWKEAIASPVGLKVTDLAHGAQETRTTDDEFRVTILEY